MLDWSTVLVVSIESSKEWGHLRVGPPFHRHWPLTRDTLCHRQSGETDTPKTEYLYAHRGNVVNHLTSLFSTDG